jgi:hypothetical protein
MTCLTGFTSVFLCCVAGTGWTAVLVERCFYAAALQTKGGGAAAAAGKASKAAKSSSRKGQKG